MEWIERFSRTNTRQTHTHSRSGFGRTLNRCSDANSSTYSNRMKQQNWTHRQPTQHTAHCCPIWYEENVCSMQKTRMKEKPTITVQHMPATDVYARVECELVWERDNRCDSDDLLYRPDSDFKQCAFWLQYQLRLGVNWRKTLLWVDQAHESI